MVKTSQRPQTLHSGALLHCGTGAIIQEASTACHMELKLLPK